MTRLLILLFAVCTLVSSMGYFGGGYNRPREPRGDWPDDFPEKPDGFNFGCKLQCYCTCKQAHKKTAKPSPEKEDLNTDDVTKATTHSSSPSPSTHTQSTVSTSTTISTTQTEPTTTTTTLSTAVPTTSTIAPSSSSTEVPTTQSSDIAPSSTTNADPVPNPIEPNIIGRVISGPAEVAQDVPENDLVTAQPQTGTTFWIRNPTPPEAPVPVQPGSESFSLGHPSFAVPAFDSAFKPDEALSPLNAALNSDLDFNIQTVGIPKSPRAPIDPDA